jgi:hypothetical protein
MSILGRIWEKLWRYFRIPAQMESIQEALGRIESRLQDNAIADPQRNPRAFEFKVYSQWGDDGIIEYLIKNVAIENKTFVEFGVETYTEANTLFLLKHRNWGGLVIDGSSRNIESIRRSDVFWKHDLLADCAFLRRDNINEIIARNGVSGEIGLLSIDIDGNDYWVWEAITCIRPQIVVVEYNSLFGPKARVSIPYRAELRRSMDRGFNMYYGASIAGLDHLARALGYSLVAGNSAGNNAFFVRKDCMGPLRQQAPQDAYVAAGFREARAADGSVTLLDFVQRQSAISSLPVVDVATGKQAAIKAFL